jgi:hypothetical protein
VKARIPLLAGFFVPTILPMNAMVISVSKLWVGKLGSGTFDGTWAEVPHKFCT